MVAKNRRPVRLKPSKAIRTLNVMLDEQEDELVSLRAQRREQDAQIALLKRQVHSLWEDRKALSRALSIVFSQIHIIEKGEEK